MNKNGLRYYDCDEIFEYLDSCYFNPTRKKYFPSAKIRYAAQCAMLRLWNMYELEFGEKVYNNQDIRRIVINEMMPEHLDDAVSRWNLSLGLDKLSRMIFFEVVKDDLDILTVLRETIVRIPPHKVKIRTEDIA